MASDLKPGISLVSLVNLITEKLYLSENPTLIIKQILELLMQSLNIDTCWVQFLDQQNSLKLIASQGLSAEMERAMQSIKPGQSLTGTVASSGEVVITSDLTRDKRHPLPAATRDGFHAFAAIPLRSQGKLYGVAGIASREIKEFAPETLQFLTVIGNHIGIALDKAELRQRALVREKELVESETRFRLFFEEARDGIIKRRPGSTSARTAL